MPKIVLFLKKIEVGLLFKAADTPMIECKVLVHIYRISDMSNCHFVVHISFISNLCQRTHILWIFYFLSENRLDSIF